MQRDLGVRLGRFWLLLLGLLLCGSGVFAQQQPVFSQYIMNTYLLNPAVAGYEGVVDVALTGREQWVGYSERPRTYALSFQMRLFNDVQKRRTMGVARSIRRGKRGYNFLDALKNGSMGVGAYLYNDVNGRMRRTGLLGSYAYHITADGLMYSLGISLSMVQFKVNVMPEDLYDPLLDDPLVVAGVVNSKFAPDGNVGFMVSAESFHAGVSVNSLFQNSLQFGYGNPNGAYRMLRQYHLLGGYRYHPARSDFAIEPSLLLAMNERLHWTLDVNFRVYYLDTYWGALSFRTMSNIVAMFGMRYKQLYFGYAFDYAIMRPQTIGKFGSHEFMVGVRFARDGGDGMGRMTNRW